MSSRQSKMHVNGDPWFEYISYANMFEGELRNYDSYMRAQTEADRPLRASAVWRNWWLDGGTDRPLMLDFWFVPDLGVIERRIVTTKDYVNLRTAYPAAHISDLAALRVRDVALDDIKQALTQVRERRRIKEPLPPIPWSEPVG